jgi:hypothetical protein
LIAHIGQTGASHQAHISCANNTDIPQNNPPHADNDAAIPSSFFNEVLRLSSPVPVKYTDFPYGKEHELSDQIQLSLPFDRWRV